jgi:hypothetical protein
MVKEISTKRAEASTPATIHPYGVTDPIPVPEAIESDSDTAWGQWEDSLSPKPSDNGPDTVFGATVPADLMDLMEPTAKMPLQP